MTEGRELSVQKDGVFCYSLILERDFGKLAEEVKKLHLTEHKICIVTDNQVGPLYGELVKKELEKVCSRVCLYTIEAGEKNKNLDTVQELYRFLIEEHFERKDMLAALGGGVVGDLTGFTAATYLRGIDFIQLPTSLLAQVDSSIGGKTGVDFACYKNMVGAFHMPRLVYMNLSTLKTLSERQYICGLGEILKHGLIKNASYYEWLLENRDGIMERKYEFLLPMIEESCRIKRDVVERDPLEQGERALLNFGHTIGHAIEKRKDFSLMHGECVAIGMAAAAEISWRRGWISKEDLEHIRQGIQCFGLPVSADDLDVEEVFKITRTDKKMEAGAIKFVLLKHLGEAVVDRTVSEEELRQAISEVVKEEVL